MMASVDEQTSLQYQQAHINDTHVPGLIAAFTISLVLATGGVAARLYARRLAGLTLHLDDWTIALSLLFTWGFIVPNCVFIGIYNFGRHEILVTDPIALTKGIQAAEIVYTAGVFCFKASICTLFWRIFPIRWFRFCQIGIVAFTGAYSITQIVCILATCIPMEAIWNPEVHGSCININQVYIVVSSFNILTDVVIIILPMPLLWGLKTTTERKVKLSIIFASGALVCIASIVRVCQLHQVSLVDPSYSDYNPVVWSSLEMAFGTIGACLPTYGPLFHRAKRLRSTSDHRLTEYY